MGYFATFIMTKLLAGLPIVLLRMRALMQFVFIKICFREKYLTQAELDEAYYPSVHGQVSGLCIFFILNSTVSHLITLTCSSYGMGGSIQISY